MDCIPCVVFGFNQPRKFARVLFSLKKQNIDSLIIFIDGPRNFKDQNKVDACKRIAESVDWIEPELYFWNTNHGLERLWENINLVFDYHSTAVFLEDDCLPMPGFYQFMKQALNKYRNVQQVFSICGYQPINRKAFSNYPFSVVSSLRFFHWGWGTWKDRWLSIISFLKSPELMFEGLTKVSAMAGKDLPHYAKDYIEKKKVPSWDVTTALACLWKRKTNLLPIYRLICNIELDGSGANGDKLDWIRNLVFHKKNMCRLETPIEWLDDVKPDFDYNLKLLDSINLEKDTTICRTYDVLKFILKRILWRETWSIYNLNLLPESQKNPEFLALFSYLTHPFLFPENDKRFFAHINNWHANEFVRVLNNMNYAVDAIDYRNKKFIPEKNYRIFIGHGGVNFSNISKKLPLTTCRIYFSTGSYWQFHNGQEIDRFESLRIRKKVKLPYDRLIQYEEESALKEADGIIGIGNEFTKTTYQDFSPVIMLNGTSLYDDFLERFPKNYAYGRNHFLFFSSKGNVHKGLDLLLEAFEGLDQHLWICSPIEKEFKSLYFQEINCRKNIHNIGWTQPRSGKFYRVVWRCNYCILPSASEGQAQSIVECMNHGLIPLVTRASGIDVENFGLYIENCSISGIRKLIQEASLLTEDKITKMSMEARRICQSKYSEEAFRKNLSDAIWKIANSK